MKKLFALMISMLTICMLLTGCGGTGTTKKDDGTLRIVTSFYPMYIATANITKGVDGVQVINMTKPQTGCLHDYQLTTDDMKTLEKADIFVANGAGMESFLDKILQQNKQLTIIEASTDISLLQAEGEENPHVWLSVPNAIQQVKNIEAQLSAADSKHAEAYKANAAAYIAKLQALDAEMHTALDNVPNKDIVTFHEAFPYFAQEFNLHIVKVVEREPGTEPTPRELENTIEEIKPLAKKVLFTEPQYSPSAAETIARETGAQIYTLDPVVTGEANENALDAYITTMKQNMETLSKALQ